MIPSSVSPPPFCAILLHSFPFYCCYTSNTVDNLGYTEDFTMSRNGDSPYLRRQSTFQHAEITKRNNPQINPNNQVRTIRILQSQTSELEPTGTNKLTWQWQKKASLRNIENSMSEVKERLSAIHSEVEASRKEDKREIKLLLDDLAVSRAKAARLEKTIEELRKEKVNIIKLNEELLAKKESEIQKNSNQYEQSLLRKDEELAKVRKEAKTTEANLRASHEKELQAKHEERVQLETQHAQNVAALQKQMQELRNDYEQKLQGKGTDMNSLQVKYETEIQELKHAHNVEVCQLNEKSEELSLKLGDALTYLNLSGHLIERKNNFISKQKQGFEKIIDHIGETDPKPVKLKGNLWKLAHYIRTGGQAAWKGYINRAQYDVIIDEADAINRIASRAVIDREYEGEDETQFRESLKDLCTQLEKAN